MEARYLQSIEEDCDLFSFPGAFGLDRFGFQEAIRNRGIRFACCFGTKREKTGNAKSEHGNVRYSVQFGRRGVSVSHPATETMELDVE